MHGKLGQCGSRRTHAKADRHANFGETRIGCFFLFNSQFLTYMEQVAMLDYTCSPADTRIFGPSQGPSSACTQVSSCHHHILASRPASVDILVIHYDNGSVDMHVFCMQRTSKNQHKNTRKKFFALYFRNIFFVSKTFKDCSFFFPVPSSSSRLCCVKVTSI